MAFESPRGVRDFGPQEMHVREHVSDILGEVFSSFGYRRVQTPTFEFLELFNLKSGAEITDHLYVLEDKGGRKLCLRPEATASVARMFASQIRTLPKPVRVYYDCPMFRYEEPQKGRYREFWQAGVELMGASGALADAEAVCMASECIRRLGLKAKIRLSSIGVIRDLLGRQGFDAKTQDELIHALDKGDFEAVNAKVTDESFLRILGLKGGSVAVSKAMVLASSEESKTMLAQLSDTLKLLDKAGVAYAVDFSMARGLDYYTGMVFDAKVDGLGAQNQICGGGRYDGLVELFGGQSTPAVGFAFGLDRLIEAMAEQGSPLPNLETDVYVVPISEDVAAQAFQIAAALRRQCPGKVVDFDLTGRKLNRALQYASDLKAKYALMVGARELAEDSVMLKDMESQKQETVAISELKARLG